MLFFLLSSYSSLFGDFTAKIDLPPRLQWEENGGYCGEVSLIAAGLYYGQYASQYDVRALIGDQRTEVLIGYNDKEAARKMKLNFIAWDHTQERKTQEFLLWVKKEAIKRHPLAIGVYMNEYRFYGNPDPLAGCTDYDHIVPVDGVESSHSLSSEDYHPDDRLFFSDNGLWDDEVPQYNFSYLFTPFQGNRREANRVGGELYTLPNEGKNYGIAITGVLDLNQETLPVRIETSLNYEKPSIKEGSEKRPKGEPLILTVTVSDLEPNTPYILYRYNRFDLVPDSDFESHADRAYKIYPFEISSGSTYTIEENIFSDEIVIYRCVKVSS